MVDLVLHSLDICAWKVYLVDDRDDLQIVVDSHVHVGQGLGFHTLGCIYKEQRPLAGRNGAGNLVGEVHMTWGVNQVEHILLPILGCVLKGYSLGFDGYSSLPLYIHVIKDLVHGGTAVHQGSLLYKTVCQCGFTMVYMGYNAKVSYPLCIHTQ